VSSDLNNLRPAFNAWVHRLALLTVGWTALVITFGGKTKSQEAGLSIAEPVYYTFHWDWLFVPNLSAEYTHRVLVPILGVFTLLLALHFLFKDPRPGMKKLAVGLIVGLGVQGVFGALTVKYFAKSHTSIPHAVLGQIFLCLVVSAAVLTSKYWLSDRKVTGSPLQPPLFKLCRALVIMVFIQLLLGAAIRHDNRGEVLVAGREMVFIWHLVAHVMGAIGVGFFLTRVIIRINRQHKNIPELYSPTRWLMILLGVQILLGTKAAILKMMTISNADAPPTMRIIAATIHVLIGATMLATAVALMLRARRLVEFDANAQPAAEVTTGTKPASTVGSAA